MSLICVYMVGPSTKQDRSVKQLSAVEKQVATSTSFAISTVLQMNIKCTRSAVHRKSQLSCLRAAIGYSIDRQLAGLVYISTFSFDQACAISCFSLCNMKQNFYYQCNNCSASTSDYRRNK
ncbi:hypothetical protein T08_305 [Trichinella sp. T8]|nr:hypothetical protein T08_305 [Trichinella sp. T8]